MSHATLTRNSALNYLAQGLSPSQVASALNVSPSYISQLLEEEEFSLELASLREKAIAADVDYDSQKDRVEKKLLDIVEQTLGTVYNPVVAMKLWRDINMGRSKAMHRTVKPGTQVVNNTVVQLSLPQQLTDKFTLNSQNQVIQAGDQTLVTMQSGSMASLAQKSREVKAAQQKEQLALDQSINEAQHVLPTFEKQDEFGFTYQLQNSPVTRAR